MNSERQLQSSVHLPFRFAVGATASRFFLALKNEKTIYATRCPACAKVSVPARSFCSVCHLPCNTWVTLTDSGTLAGWSDMPTKEGYRIALIRLSGADNLFVHRLGHCAGVPLQIGMSVVADWAETREGKLTDILCFRPRCALEKAP